MKRIVTMFPGQGSQRPNMLYELYIESSTVRQTFEEASDILGYSVYKSCTDADEEMLSDIAINSPLILTAGVAAYRHFIKNYHIIPNALIGHSLGEYTALVCAGVIGFDEALKLTVFRANLAKRIKRDTDSITAVVSNGQIKKAEQLCASMRLKNRNIWISCYNSYTQVSVSGKEKDVAAFLHYAANSQSKVTYLKNSAPYHCPLMHSIAEEFREYLREIPISDDEELFHRVISGVNLQYYKKDNFTSFLVQQLFMPIQWIKVINKCIPNNMDAFIEMGSKRILRNFLRDIAPKEKSYGYELAADRKNLESYLIQK